MVLARKPNISIINCVLSIIFLLKAFSKFLCWTGDNEQSTIIKSTKSRLKFDIIWLITVEEKNNEDLGIEILTIFS